MKKNFFKKKLASGLALALVVASLAPAGLSASAATATKVVKQGGGKAPAVMYVGGAKVDFGLSKVYKSNKYAWTVSDSSIATITKTTGVVTAKAPGTVTIKATARNSSGKWLNAFSHKITIKQRVTSIDINAEDFSLAVGEEKDLDAVKNPKTSTDSVRYASSDEKVATVNATTGVVKAVGVGEATITVYSKAAWNTPNTSTYNRTDSVKVSVLDGIQSVKQTTTNKLEVTLATDSKEKLTKDNLVITDANGVKQIIKEVKFSGDGKTATAEVFINFVDKATYKVSYADTEKEFVASVGEVASVVLANKTVKFSDPSSLDVKLFDANGVEVTTEDKVRNNVTFDYDMTKAYVTYDSSAKKHQITVFNFPESVKVKAVYHTYEYNGADEKTFTSEAVINSVEKLPTTAKDITFTVVNDSKADWNKVNTTIPSTGKGYRLFVKAKNQADKDITEEDFTYESTDLSVLSVSKVTENGKDVVYVYGTKAGTAYVKATFGDTIKMLPITVGAESKATSVTIDKQSTTLYASTKITDDKQTFTLTAKDQYNNTMTGKTVAYEKLSGEADLNVSVDGNKVSFTIKNVPAKTTSNVYKLTYYDRTYSVTVTASKVTDEKVTSIRLEADNASSVVDVAVNGATKEGIIVNYTAYGYNSNGQKVEVLTNVDFTVKHKNDVVYDLSANKTTAVFTESNGVATFSALDFKGTNDTVSKASVGTYVINVKATIDGTTRYDAKTITVNDTQVAITSSRKEHSVNPGTVRAAIEKAVKFSTDVDSIVSVKANYAGKDITLDDSVAKGGTLYIDKVTVLKKVETAAGTRYVKQEVSVGLGFPVVD